MRAGSIRSNGGSFTAATTAGFGASPAFRGRTDMKAEELFKVITEGRRGADVMPAWEKGFSAEKRWELVAYILHLGRQPAAK